MQLTIFYDGNCPLCVAEMEMLRKYDQHSALRLEDINTAEFSAEYPQVDVTAANRILHGLTHRGEMIYGLDVTVAAWSLVGRKKWLKILRWPLVSWFADKAYLFFARNRYAISGLFTGRKYCDQQRCEQGVFKNKPRANCSRNTEEDAEF